MANDAKYKAPDAGKMVSNEIRAIIKRYADESDITIYEVVGVLESIKMDLLLDKDEDEEEGESFAA